MLEFINNKLVIAGYTLDIEEFPNTYVMATKHPNDLLEILTAWFEVYKDLPTIEALRHFEAFQAL